MPKFKHYKSIYELIREYNYKDPLFIGSTYFVAKDNILNQWCFVHIHYHKGKYYMNQTKEPECYNSLTDIIQDTRIVN